MNTVQKSKRKVSIDVKIQRAQEVVLRTKAKYEKALDVLEKLMAIRKQCQQKELMEALEKSGRTFEDVMRFLKG